MSTADRLRAVDQSLHARLRRMRKQLLPILQTGLAAGLAYWLSKDVIGHERPFFAPIAVVLIIGISTGDRLSKSADIALGCMLGVLVGDLLFYRLGDGGWQIAVIVAGALLIATFFSKSQLLVNQVAIGSILIATIMPPGAEVTGIDRTIDAFVGCTVALLTLALIPQAPMASARAEIAHVMGLMSSVLDDVARGLNTRNPDCISEALDAIRGSQSRIDDMAAAIQSGKESTAISPFLWGSRRYLQSMGRVIPPVDNAVRTTRVLARRALVLCEDGDVVSDVQVELIDRLALVCLEISEVYDNHRPRGGGAAVGGASAGIGSGAAPLSADSRRKTQAEVIPRLVNELRAVAQASGMDVLHAPATGKGLLGATGEATVADNPIANNATSTNVTPAASPAPAAAPAAEPREPVLSAYAILAQTRSLTVDLLQVCGMSRESALAALAPTSKTPRYEPERFDF